MNKVILIGNLTKDTEFTTTTSGVSVCKINIAVKRRFKTAEGQSVTDFFTIVCWRNIAENCHKYLRKGDKISVVGELQTRNYEVKGEKRYITEIMAEEISFLNTKNKSESKEEQPKQEIMQPITDEELPF